ncbi:MAG: N-acetyl-gamma-glutamyl-phosphate reductase [Chloroflexota bacterium]
MSRLRTAIINVTGYIGVELARLLLQHPEVELSCVTGRSAAGQKLRQVFPHLGDTEHVIVPELDQEVDVVFSAMPHKASAEAVAPLIERGIRVVDVSADFRLKRAEEYEKWYGTRHPRKDLLDRVAYGLPELHRAEISDAALVANPGCYPTGVILALAPVVWGRVVEPELVADSKSGVSGAGRTVSLTTHYAEVNENAWAYGLEGHRHLPEMEQELVALAADGSLALAFQPHLVPMTRGILSTCYGRLKAGSAVGGEKLRDLYREFYREAPFVRVTDEPPQTKHTCGSNYCLVYPTVNPRTGWVVVVSCVDNLVKGGAGQAVQNMNLMLGLPEDCGLERYGIYP